jgi:hypothetical protein
MFHLRHFTGTTQRFVSIPVEYVEMFDLAWYPDGEDTARCPDPRGFGNLEIRFQDGKRMVAKWEVTQNEFLRDLVQPMEIDKKISRPAGTLYLYPHNPAQSPRLTFLSREDFWET